MSFTGLPTGGFAPPIFFLGKKTGRARSKRKSWGDFDFPPHPLKTTQGGPGPLGTPGGWMHPEAFCDLQGLGGKRIAASPLAPCRSLRPARACALLALAPERR